MRTSAGQYRQLLEQRHGFVITVMVATPDAVRRGFMRTAAMNCRSNSGVTFQLSQRAGSLSFTSR